MNSLGSLLAGVNPLVPSGSMRAAAKKIGMPPPHSLRRMLAATAVEVTFLSYTTPKFWDDDPRGDLSSISLEMVMTYDRQVGNETWRRGHRYTPNQARNAIAMAKPVLESLRDQFVFLWDNAVVGYYEAAKDALVGAAADVINTAVPGTCEQQCKAHLKATLEGALAAIGLPPDIPTSRQLVSAGASYLASEMVDAVAPGLVEAVGVVGGEQALHYAQTMEAEAREAARAELQAHLEAQAASMLLPPPVNPTDDPYTWGIPDPVYLARPAVLHLNLRPREGFDSQLAHGTWCVVPSRIFAPATFTITHLPKDGVNVPVTLWPSIGRFVKANDAKAQGLDFDGWYATSFKGTMRANTAPYDLYDAGEGVPFYISRAEVRFTVKTPKDVEATARNVYVAGEHNISWPGALGDPVFQEVFTLRAPSVP